MSSNNSQCLEREFQWFELVLEQQFKSYFDPEGEYSAILPPDLSKGESVYAQVIKKYGFDHKERLIICLALAPHLKSQILDLFFTTNSQLNRPFTEFGGYTGKDHKGFLPTGETAAFLLSKGYIQDRFGVWELFSAGHAFASENILQLERTHTKEPLLSGRLIINNELLYALTSSENYFPESTDLFPAKKITTELEWKDLIVSPSVMEEILTIKTWIEHRTELFKDEVFRKHVKPGFRSLFYGPPGTGKTMTASLIGKTCGLDVYRIDLNNIASNYIGETEKNLKKIFKEAEKKDWILFFDEADALFGKRTQSNSSNDGFTKQEVAYLLQRIEDFSGVVILASNLKLNIDEAFSRRLQSTIKFSMPDRNQRLHLWKNIFSPVVKPSSTIDFERLAEDHELSGGSMTNILRDSMLQTIKHKQSVISEKNIKESIRKEFQKHSRTI